MYLREDLIRDEINGWLGGLFAPETVAALVATQNTPSATSGTLETAKKRLADARLRRFQAAIGAGVDPEALTEAINEAQAERAAARAELENRPPSNVLTDAEIYAMIDSLGDVGAALSSAKPDRLANLYQAVDLQVRYEPAERAADIKIHPVSRVNSVRVRGGSCALTTRLRLPDIG
ncbi:hypothetical protein [Saccharopolyspora sp. 5N708]|uniref:hypothetical protein n=1 Tax=Saccharopolyspora sp. 5N708 TaxID=3457424 RepID=UPI003FD0C416